MSWKDFDINFGKQSDGDITGNTEEDAIKNSLRNICSTFQGSRRMRPTFALPIYSLLFEPMDEDTAYKLAQTILEGINEWDDRILIENVVIETDYDNLQYSINLEFKMITSNVTDNITFILKQV